MSNLAAMSDIFPFKRFFCLSIRSQWMKYVVGDERLIFAVLSAATLSTPNKPFKSSSNIAPLSNLFLIES